MATGRGGTRGHSTVTAAARSLAELGLHAAGGREAQITGLSVDNRTVAPGHLFAALPGSLVHGARYAEAAVARGAGAVLTDRAGAALLSGLEVPVVVAEDARQKRENNRESDRGRTKGSRRSC